MDAVADRPAAPPEKCAVVQDQRRFYREALGAILGERLDLRVHQVETASELLVAVQALAVTVAIMDLDDPADGLRPAIRDVLASGAQLIGTRSTSNQVPDIDGEITVVDRRDPLTGVLRVIAPSCPRPAPEMLPLGRRTAGQIELTDREVRILALISIGATEAAIAERLGVSGSTVESCKEGSLPSLACRTRSPPSSSPSAPG